MATMVRELTGQDDLAEAERKQRRLGTNRRPDRQIEGTKMNLLTRRTQRYPRIPLTMHEFKVIAHWSWNCPELRPVIPGFRI
jgi:hypothetical protein